jgi:quercetin dioxygenase-like cupin family protein
MDHTKSADIPVMPGPATTFTGTVRMEPMPRLPEPARVRVARVSFEPGARTAWHSHPFGQMLVVVSGEGWACQEGGEKVILRPGDVVRFPADVRHWHGATSDSAMTHMAIQEADEDGETTDWQEHVADADYLA